MLAIFDPGCPLASIHSSEFVVTRRANITLNLRWDLASNVGKHVGAGGGQNSQTSVLETQGTALLQGSLDSIGRRAGVNNGVSKVEKKLLLNME